MSQRLIEVFTTFDNLTDPRVERTRRHELFDLVVVALCATLAGADGWADVERFGKERLTWLRSFLPLLNGIPSHDTFGQGANEDTHTCCVRRAFLCGQDPLTGRNYDHRKAWRPILERLAVNAETWLDTIGSFGRWFHRAVGRVSSMAARASRSGKHWFQGTAFSRLAFD